MEEKISTYNLLLELVKRSKVGSVISGILFILLVAPTILIVMATLTLWGFVAFLDKVSFDSSFPGPDDDFS